MCRVCVRVCVCARARAGTRAQRYPQSSEVSVRSSRAKVTGSCEQPSWVLATKLVLCNSASALKI